MTEAPTFSPPSVGGALANRRLALRIEDPTTRADWDDLLATHPQATFFHSSAWAKTLTTAYGFRCRYVTAIADGRLKGLLPVIEADSWLRGKRAVSLPFTDECSPLVSENVEAESLFSFAVEEGKRRHWKYLELRGGHDVFAGLPESVSYFSHVLPLESSPDILFESCDSAVRRAVRKAERCGVSVHFANVLDSIRAYHRLHCRTRTKHGAPPQPFSFFRSLCDHAFQSGHGFVALATHQDRPIAGAVFLQFGNKAIYKYSASDERYQDLRGPNLVIWRSLQKLAAAGIKELNFGKTSVSNEGLRRFKSGWGSEERTIRYARYSFATKNFVKFADLAAGAQRRIFSLLPVFCSRWIGRAVYAHMS